MFHNKIIAGPKAEFKEALYHLNESLSNVYMSSINSIAEDIVQKLTHLDQVAFATYSVEDLPSSVWTLMEKLKKETNQIKHLTTSQNSENPYLSEDLEASIKKVETGLFKLSEITLVLDEQYI